MNRTPAARHDADPGVPALVQLLVAAVVLAGGALGAHAWLVDTCPAGTAPAAACELVLG